MILSKGQERMLYKRLTNIDIEDTKFTEVVEFGFGGIAKRIDFEIMGEYEEEVSFFISPTNKLYGVSYYKRQSLKLWANFEEENESYHVFNPIWQSFQKHHKLRVRLLF